MVDSAALHATLCAVAWGERDLYDTSQGVVGERIVEVVKPTVGGVVRSVRLACWRPTHADTLKRAHPRSSRINRHVIMHKHMSFSNYF